MKSLITAWTKAGGSLKWGAGGVGLRMPLDIKGEPAKPVGVCFLAPKFAGKQDRIELGCTSLAKQLCQPAVQALQDRLREAAGANCKGSTMISAVCPGKLDAKSQKQIIKSLLSSAS